MTANLNLKGKCLCGAVKVTGVAKDAKSGACHCSMCRAWSSGPFMEVVCNEVSFEGGDNIGRIKSSEWAERGFCKMCGSSLFYQVADSDEYLLSAGLFEDLSGYEMHLQVFTDERPHYYALANETEEMTGAELFAKFAGPEQ